MKSGHKSLFQRAVTFSVKIVTDGWFDPLHALSSLPEGALLKIAVMLAFAGLLGGARMLLKSPLVTPVAFFGFAIVPERHLTGRLSWRRGWLVSLDDTWTGGLGSYRGHTDRGYSVVCLLGRVTGTGDMCVRRPDFLGGPDIDL